MNLNKYSLTNKNIIQSICIAEDNHIKKQTPIEVKITKKKTDYFYPSLNVKIHCFGAGSHIIMVFKNMS